MTRSTIDGEEGIGSMAKLAPFNIFTCAHTCQKKGGAELKGAMPLSNQQKFCFTLQSLYVGPSKDLSPDHQYISIKHG
jgi:hypothetical protein